MIKVNIFIRIGNDILDSIVSVLDELFIHNKAPYMGHRANFILKENEELTIYYSHQKAQSTCSLLAQGLAYIKSYCQEYCHIVDYLIQDNAFAEGGFIIDVDKRYILVYGGEAEDSVAVQRMFIQTMHERWKGWTLEWASAGMVGIAKYLDLMEGYTLYDFVATEHFIPAETWLGDECHGAYQDEVVTIIHEGVVKDYVLDFYGEDLIGCLARGTAVKDEIPDELIPKEWQNESETINTLLLDYDHKRLFVAWALDTDDRFMEHIKSIWTGWIVQRQNIGLSFHFTYTNRDASPVLLTKALYESYCKEHRMYDFDPKRIA